MNHIEYRNDKIELSKKRIDSAGREIESQDSPLYR